MLKASVQDSEHACEELDPFPTLMNSPRQATSSHERVGDSFGAGKRRRILARAAIKNSLAQTIYAQSKPLVESGSARILRPEAAKIALHTAGSTGGRAGSPNPVGG